MNCSITPNKYSKLITDYLNEEQGLDQFFNDPFSLEGLKNASLARKFTQDNRISLVKTLNKQYEGLIPSEETKTNINSLIDSNTFTITTGHQLSLFTGPLYFIYKILSAIRLCEQMSKEMPSHNFVPIYWMASEDHDFEEINHFHLFNKRYTWNSDQKGAVGKFSTDDIEELLKELGEDTEMF